MGRKPPKWKQYSGRICLASPQRYDNHFRSAQIRSSVSVTMPSASRKCLTFLLLTAPGSALSELLTLDRSKVQALWPTIFIFFKTYNYLHLPTNPVKWVTLIRQALPH